jgi:hypothetical protein
LEQFVEGAVYILHEIWKFVVRVLGGEQSGFINEIGFDTYQKIMKREELKEKSSRPVS